MAHAPFEEAVDDKYIGGRKGDADFEEHHVDVGWGNVCGAVNIDFGSRKARRKLTSVAYGMLLGHCGLGSARSVNLGMTYDMMNLGSSPRGSSRWKRHFEQVRSLFSINWTVTHVPPSRKTKVMLILRWTDIWSRHTWRSLRLSRTKSFYVYHTWGIGIKRISRSLSASGTARYWNNIVESRQSAFSVSGSLQYAWTSLLHWNRLVNNPVTIQQATNIRRNIESQWNVPVRLMSKILR